MLMHQNQMCVCAFKQPVSMSAAAVFAPKQLDLAAHDKCMLQLQLLTWSIIAPGYMAHC